MPLDITPTSLKDNKLILSVDLILRRVNNVYNGYQLAHTIWVYSDHEYASQHLHDLPRRLVLAVEANVGDETIDSRWYSDVPTKLAMLWGRMKAAMRMRVNSDVLRAVR